MGKQWSPSGSVKEVTEAPAWSPSGSIKEITGDDSPEKKKDGPVGSTTGSPEKSAGSLTPAAPQARSTTSVLDGLSGLFIERRRTPAAPMMLAAPGQPPVPGAPEGQPAPPQSFGSLGGAAAMPAPIVQKSFVERFAEKASAPKPKPIPVPKTPEELADQAENAEWDKASGERRGFWSEMEHRTATGIDILGKMIATVPSGLLDLAIFAENAKWGRPMTYDAEMLGKIAENEYGISEKYNPLSPNNAMHDHYEAREKINGVDNGKGYKGGITDAIGLGRWGDAGKLAAYGVTESLPVMLGLMASRGAGASEAASLTGLGVATSGTTYDDLKRDHPEMDKNVLMLNGILTGVGEAASELIGTSMLYNQGKKLFMKGAINEAEEVVKKGIGGFIDKSFKRAFVGSAVIADMTGEATNQVWKNAVDKWSDVDPGRDYLDGVGDAAIISLATSGVMGGTIKALSKLKAPVRAEVDARLNEIDQIHAQFENPNLTPATQAVLSKKLGDITEQINDHLDTDRNDYQGLSLEDQGLHDSLTEQKNVLSEALADPALTPEIRASIANDISGLDAQIMALKPAEVAPAPETLNTRILEADNVVKGIQEQVIDTKDETAKANHFAALQAAVEARTTLQQQAMDNATALSKPAVEASAPVAAPADPAQGAPLSVDIAEAKEGDVVYHKGEEVQVVSKKKTDNGSDIVEVKTNKRSSPEEIREKAINEVAAVKGISREEALQNNQADIDNAADFISNKELNENVTYEIDADTWKAEVRNDNTIPAAPAEKVDPKLPQTFDDSVGEYVDYNGVQGVLQKDENGFHVVDRDGHVHQVESSLSGQSPADLGLTRTTPAAPAAAPVDVVTPSTYQGPSSKELRKERDAKLAAIKDKSVPSSKGRTSLGQEVDEIYKQKAALEEKIKQAEEEVEKTLTDLGLAAEEAESLLDTILSPEGAEVVNKLLREEPMTEEEKKVVKEEKAPEETPEQYVKKSFTDYLRGVYQGKLAKFFDKVKVAHRKISLVLFYKDGLRHARELSDRILAAEPMTEQEQKAVEEEKTPEETPEAYIKKSFREYLRGVYDGKLSNFFAKVKDKLRKALLIASFAAISAAHVTGNFSVNEYIQLAKNYSERHLEVKPDVKMEAVVLKPVNNRMGDSMGTNKIPYKGGYATNQVINLDSNTFEYRSREDRTPVTNAVGITTNLFRPMLEVSEVSKTEKPEQTVIALDKKTGKIKAGKLGDFGADHLVSVTYSFPVEFELVDGKIKASWNDNIGRRTPISTASYQQLAIGVDAKEEFIDPEKHNTFGVLEGGKMLLVVGDYQVQVNGGFADIYRVWKSLKNSHPGQSIIAYGLDNGSYNLPILKENGEVTSEDLQAHTLRNKNGGASLIMKKKAPEVVVKPQVKPIAQKAPKKPVMPGREMPVSSALQLVAMLQGLDLAIRAYRRAKSNKVATAAEVEEAAETRKEIDQMIDNPDKEVILVKIAEMMDELNKQNASLQSLREAAVKPTKEMAKALENFARQANAMQRATNAILAQNAANKQERELIKKDYDSQIEKALAAEQSLEPVSPQETTFDLETNTITIRGKEYQYEAVVTDPDGKTSSLRVRDEDGKIRFIRDQDAILEVEIQKEIAENLNSGIYSVENIKNAAKEIGAEPAVENGTGSPEGATEIQQTGPAENTEADQKEKQVSDGANQKAELAGENGIPVDAAVSTPENVLPGSSDVGDAGSGANEQGAQTAEQKVESYKARRKKVLNNPPRDFREAVLQYFLSGSSISTEDFIRYTGFGYITNSLGKIVMSPELKQAKMNRHVAARPKKGISPMDKIQGGTDIDMVLMYSIPEFFQKDDIDMEKEIAFVALTMDKTDILNELEAYAEKLETAEMSSAEMGRLEELKAEDAALKAIEADALQYLEDEHIDFISSGDGSVFYETIADEINSLTLSDDEIFSILDLAEKFMNADETIDWESFEAAYAESLTGFDPDFLDVPDSFTLTKLFEYGGAAKEQINEIYPSTNSQSESAVIEPGNTQENETGTAATSETVSQQPSLNAEIAEAEQAVKVAQQNVKVLEAKYAKLTEKLAKNLQENQQGMFENQTQSMFGNEGQQDIVSKTKAELDKARSEAVIAQAKVLRLQDSRNQTELFKEQNLMDRVFDTSNVAPMVTFLESLKAKRGGALFGFIVPVGPLYNAAINLVIAGVKAGNSLRNAMIIASEYLADSGATAEEIHGFEQSILQGAPDELSAPDTNAPAAQAPAATAPVNTNQNSDRNFPEGSIERDVENLLNNFDRVLTDEDIIRGAMRTAMKRNPNYVPDLTRFTRKRISNKGMQEHMEDLVDFAIGAMGYETAIPFLMEKMKREDWKMENRRILAMVVNLRAGMDPAFNELIEITNDLATDVAIAMNGGRDFKNSYPDDVDERLQNLLNASAEGVNYQESLQFLDAIMDDTSVSEDDVAAVEERTPEEAKAETDAALAEAARQAEEATKKKAERKKSTKKPKKSDTGMSDLLKEKMQKRNNSALTDILNKINEIAKKC